MRPRDVEQLYYKYAKLRNKLVRQEMSRFAYRDSKTGKVVYDKAQVDDLRSYVDYQFVKLTNEYDPNSAIDFPAYIKTKLTLRVRHSYIKRKYKHYYQTHALQEDNDKVVENTLYRNALQEWSLGDESEILNKIAKLDLLPVEKDIIKLWLQPPEIKKSMPVYNSNRTIYHLLRNKYPEYTREQLFKLISDLRERLKTELS